MFFVLKRNIKYYINKLAVKIILKSDKYFQYRIVSNYIDKYPEDQKFINAMFEFRKELNHQQALLRKLENEKDKEE